MKGFHPPYPAIIQKGLRHPFWQQHLILLFCMGLVLYLPVLQCIQQVNQWHQIQLEYSEVEQQLTHKQQIVASLKQQSERALLTPELANHLLPINQQIQQANSTDLYVEHTYWTFQQQPVLSVTLQAKFTPLQSFLIKLLENNQTLEVLTLKIYKSDDPEENRLLQTDIKFQLPPFTPSAKTAETTP